MKRFILVTILIVQILLLPPTVFGAACGTGPFYVSSAIGSDTNNGTSAATPWAHHPFDGNRSGNAACSLAAANTVYARQGDVWYDVDLSASIGGNSGSPIITTSINTFAAPGRQGVLPKISGAWNPASLSWGGPTGGIYSTATITTSPNVVVYTSSAGVESVLTKNTSTPTTPSLGQYGYSASTLYVNVGEAPSAGILEAAEQNYVVVNSAAYQTFSYLEIRVGNTGGNGIAYNTGYSNIIYDHCNVKGYAYYGIYHLNGANCAVTNTEVTEAMAGANAGIFGSGSNGLTVMGNNIHDNQSGWGIKLSALTGALVGGLNPGQGNIVTRNIGGGIDLASVSTSSVLGNTLQNNGTGVYNTGSGPGIAVTGSSSSNVIGWNFPIGNYIGIELAASTQTAGNLTIFNIASNNTVNDIDVEATANTAGVYELLFFNTVNHNPSPYNLYGSCTGVNTPVAGCTGSGTGYVGHGLDAQSAAYRVMFVNNLVNLGQIGPNCQGFSLSGPFVSILTDYNLVYDATTGRNGDITQLSGTFYTAAQQAAWLTAIRGNGSIFGLDGVQAHAESHELITNPCSPIDQAHSRCLRILICSPALRPSARVIGYRTP